ncbi:MAG: Glycosyltransferase, partial [uncultured Thermomicrobiales bacterium]
GASSGVFGRARRVGPRLPHPDGRRRTGPGRPPRPIPDRAGLDFAGRPCSAAPRVGKLGHPTSVPAGKRGPAPSPPPPPPPLPRHLRRHRPAPAAGPRPADLRLQRLVAPRDPARGHSPPLLLPFPGPVPLGGCRLPRSRPSARRRPTRPRGGLRCPAADGST